MPSGISATFGLSELPIGAKQPPLGPRDDWKWSEGRPPAHGSPLIPFSYIPWHKMKWAAEPIIPPRLSFQGFLPESAGNVNKLFTLNTVVNNPTYIKDHHVIAMRKMVEQLWSPKIHAHIHLEVSGEIFVKPLYSIIHGAFISANYYVYWPSIISPINPDKPYIFSVGGYVENDNGHIHYWNAGADGSNTWKAKIHFEHGGSIPGEGNAINIGNYEKIKVEYQWVLTRYFRQVFSQDGDNIWSGDFNAFTRTVHLKFYNNFRGDFLLGYASHAGDYWSDAFNTVAYGAGRAPGALVGANGTIIQKNIILSSCRLPQREHGLNSWFPSDNGSTHDVIVGYSILYDHAYMIENSVNRFVQQSVYSPSLGESVGVNNPLSYFTETESSPWIEGEFFELTVSSQDEIVPPPQNVTLANGSTFIKSLIGTRLVPRFRVTYRDGNNNVKLYIVTNTEFYGSNIPFITADIAGTTGGNEPTV
jgi:hypothetical protein